MANNNIVWAGLLLAYEELTSVMRFASEISIMQIFINKIQITNNEYSVSKQQANNQNFSLKMYEKETIIANKVRFWMNYFPICMLHFFIP